MKGTKKSLFVSVLSLVLCVAMLLGTTYAWFTDSVQSGKNTITAGNLDVELTHSNGKVTDENVDGATKLFNVAKWEPGVVAYENFTVKNVGNLALKYKLQLGLYDYNTLTVDNVARSLADVLKVSVQQGIFNGTREEAMALAKTDNKTVSDFVKESKLGAKGTESANDIYSVIIYWEPSEKDNLYNVNNGRTVDKLHDDKNELFIEFGVHLVATQDTVEADFYDEFYDKNATYDQMPNFKKATGSEKTSRTSDVNAGKTGSNLEIEINAKDLTGTEVKLGDAEVPKKAIDGVLDKFLDPMPQNIPEGTVIKDDVVFTLNVETTSVKSDATVLDITMFGEATRTETDGEGEPKVIASESGQITELDAPVLVPLKLQAGLKNLKTTHTHTDKTTGQNVITEMTKVDSDEAVIDGTFFYNEETGDFLARMSKFSEVKITYDPIADVARIGNVGYPSLYNAFEASKSGDIVTVLQNSTMPAVSKANIALDLNGFNVSGIAVENSTLGVNGNGALSVTVGAGAMLNVEDGEHESLTLYGAGDVNINGGKYSAVVFGEGSTNTLNVTGGEFLLTEEADIQKIEASLADGIYLKAGENNWYSASPFEDYHVAKIGNKPFTSLNAALSAAKDGDTITVLNNVTENITVTSAGERSNDNIIIDLNGKTLTGSVKLYDCDTVTLKNGSVMGQIIIGEHKSATIKWKHLNYGDNLYEAVYGYHPLAPAKNIVFENINVDAGSKTSFYFTNIEDDLTRGAPTNYCDNDLYGKYIYKTGYTNKDQYIYNKKDEVFTVCTVKDSVTVKGGSFKGSAFTGNMVTYSGEFIDGVLTVTDGASFIDDTAGRFVADGKFLVGTSADSYVIADTAPETYTANTGKVYYTYAGGANAAIKFANIGETVYIAESADAVKELGQGDVFTVISLNDSAKWTGAKASSKVESPEAFEIMETVDENNANKRTYSVIFSVVARIYHLGDTRITPSSTTSYDEYGSLKTAFENAGAGDYVQLMRDVIINDSQYLEDYDNYGLNLSARMAFDLNGHTLIYTGDGCAIICTATTGGDGGSRCIRDTSATGTGTIYATHGYAFEKFNGGSSKSEAVYIHSGNFISGSKNAVKINNATTFGIDGGRFISLGNVDAISKGSVVNYSKDSTTEIKCNVSDNQYMILNDDQAEVKDMIVSGDDSIITVPANTTAFLPALSKTGYAFGGWYDSTKVEKISNGGLYTAGAEEVTLKTNWVQKNEFKLSVTTTNATVDVKVNGADWNGVDKIKPNDKVIVSVSYSQTQSQSCTIKDENGTTYTVDTEFEMPRADVTINASSSAPACLIPGTLITMADGTQKPVEEISAGDLVLTWNFETGSYDSKPIVFNDIEKPADFEVIYVTFSDGTEIGIVSEHGFFDVNLGKYVYFNRNASYYLDHAFLKADGSTVTLTNVRTEHKQTSCYSPVAFGDLAYYANEMLSMPGGISGLFNIFKVDLKTMKFDEEQMAKDIKAFGLLTMADYGDIVNEKMFEAFNGQYLGIPIAKGNLSWQDIEYLAARYAPLCQ